MNGKYGTFSFDQNTVVWGYTLNNASSTVQTLSADQTVYDTLNVASLDGTAIKEIKVAIAGTNETPTNEAPTIAKPDTGSDDPNNSDNDNLGNSSATTIEGDNNNSVDNQNDLIYGGAGGDTINGNNGADTIYGGSGDDKITGGNQSDNIYGGTGNDNIQGNTSNDTIYGGSGNDTIHGNEGNDLIIGGFGADVLYGNNGADTFKFLSTRDTGDTIQDFSGSGLDGDVLNFSAISGISNHTTSNSQTVTANSINYFLDASNNTVVWADTDGNISTVEIQVTLIGNHTSDIAFVW